MVLFGAIVSCAKAEREQRGRADEAPTAWRARQPPSRFALTNRFAYIPPQCYVKTRGEDGAPTSNPCYACHVRSEPPNYANDADLQVALTLPVAAGPNPWENVLKPPMLHTQRA